MTQGIGLDPELQAWIGDIAQAKGVWCRHDRADQRIDVIPLDTNLRQLDLQTADRRPESGIE